MCFMKEIPHCEGPLRKPHCIRAIDIGSAAKLKYFKDAMSRKIATARFFSMYLYV